MSALLEGATGTAYQVNATDHHDAIAKLRWGYTQLLNRYGGIAPALVAIASMLDIVEVGAREGLRPDIAELLVRAATGLRQGREVPRGEKQEGGA